MIWADKSWPIKPDIVMEGGNQAIDPTTGQADYVDDLMLLTTRMSPVGALLTTTADTSAAAALAARYGAIILANYRELSAKLQNLRRPARRGARVMGGRAVEGGAAPS